MQGGAGERAFIILKCEMEVLMPNLNEVCSPRMTDDEFYFDHDWYTTQMKGSEDDCIKSTQIPTPAFEGENKSS